METFLDGGLFEMLAYIVFIGSINFIFLRKYLLILYSISMIACPIVLLIWHTGEIFYFLMGFCLLNSILSVLLIWKAKKEKPHEALFELKIPGNVKAVKKNIVGLINSMRF